MTNTRKKSVPQSPRIADAPSARKSGARQRVGKQNAKHPEGAAKRVLDMLSISDTSHLGLPLPAGWGEPSERRRPFEVDPTVLHSFQHRSLREGAFPSRYGPDWDLSGKGKFKCASVKSVTLTRDPRRSGLVEPKWNEILREKYGSSINMKVRCRKCEPCLKARSALWKLRGIQECNEHVRTWFVTLTFAPEARTRADYAAALRLGRRGLDDSDPNELFRERQRYLGPHVTRWLKRVRKGHRQEGESPVAFRYLLVVEAHKDGFPHYHLLLHEKRLGDVTKRRIQRNWTAGYSSARLVGVPRKKDKPGMTDADRIHRDVAYTCKYIAKEALTRIRASDAYGVNHL